MTKSITRNTRLLAALSLFVLSCFLFPAQLWSQTHICPTMVSRNNGNGGTTSCPGVSGTLVASSTVGTPYQTVPAGSKTADIILKGSNSDPWYSNPPVIISVYTTTNGTSTSINSYPGPPGVPSSGNVKYCSYAGSSGNGNMPNAGIVSIRFATPTNISDNIVCTYDFSNSNSLITTPQTVISLPVHFYSFSANKTGNSVYLEWTSSRDKNADRFMVERSSDGIDFRTINSQPALPANSNEAAAYHFTDQTSSEINAGKLFYRIVEKDFDGQLTYSHTLAVHLVKEDQPLSMAMQGNTLVVKGANGNGTLQYIGMDGRVLKQQSMTFSGTTSLSIDNNNQETSFIRLITDNKVCVCRL